ncbi:endoribonuclease Dicer [Anopheles maculipalpis]|uniref:endoribonuclease Dicer n=1 Tax=Anopheles maculipalpis TaxID=1496333 RepID=UPI0021598D73|nr:endoribonuclease Dicer [Anopheles maculipalpis]
MHQTMYTLFLAALGGTFFLDPALVAVQQYVRACVRVNSPGFSTSHRNTQESDTSTQPMEDFAPRNYQSQLKEICLAKNTIVYLPTGSGKTYIALMVMKEISYQVQNKIDEGGKRTFFLANTVALAKQQAQFFTRHMPFNVKLYTSEVNVDAWKSDRWHSELSEGQIIICTSQILLDVLKHGYMQPANINLLVFDECHRAVGQHPMHAIMKEIIAAPAKDRPRVLGLSGTLLFKELKLPELVPAELERLENTFSATIATVANYEEFKEVASFSTNPQEVIIPYRMPAIHSIKLAVDILDRMQTFMTMLEDVYLPEYSTQSNRTLLTSTSKPIKEVRKALNEFKNQMEELGQYPASLAILAVIVQLEVSKRQAACNKARQVYRSAISFCDMVRHELVEAMSGFSVVQQIISFSSDRVKKLLQYLQQSYSTHDDQKKQAIVFVTRRFTAKVLYHLIKIYFQSLLEGADSTKESLVNPDFIVGANAPLDESIDAILVSKMDRRVIENFRKHKINVLCATNVLEEGIDLQMCNMVIMFDEPKTYAAFMQSKGRARMKTSTYLLMTSIEDKEAFISRIRRYRAIEARLKQELIGKTINRPEPLIADVEKELLDDMIPPFYTPFGAKLDVLSSIQLLNRYCMSMPRDLFTDSNVTWHRTDSSDGKVTVSVKLPFQSTVREVIVGQPMANVKLAKQSAAFNACKQLFEAGELNMNLLPISNRDKVEELSDKYFQHWRNMANEPRNAQPGTMKYVRSHKICYPQETIGGTPRTDGEPGCYVYILRTRAHFEASARHESVRILSDLYNSGNSFGILTRNKLPPLAKIKLFVTLGPIEVELVPKPIPIILAPDSGALQSLKRFHLMLFRDLLKVWKPFTVLDAQPEENGFIVVPMVRGECIDWDLVNRFPYLRSATELSPRARANLRFEPEAYQLRVIHPWYKNDPDQNYVVVQVRDDLRPISAFPNEKYNSYEDYFYKEHHQVITRREDQFLIEVKGITTSLNRLHPGGEADGGASTRARNWEFQEVLIPELVHNYEFPADYWLQATLLPSALHRVHFLLLAEGIRIDLAERAQIGSAVCTTLEPVTVDRLSSHIQSKSSNFSEEEEEEDSSEEELATVATHQGALEKTPDRKSLLEILKQIHNESSSVIDRFTYPWEETEEPKDLDRNWDTLNKFDLDYFASFVNKYNPRVETIVTSVYSSMTDTNKVDELVANLNLNRTEVIEEVTMQRRDIPAITDGLDDGRLSEIAMLKLTWENTQDVPLQQADLLQAITTKSSSDVFNLERFEVLGDAFLKFGVSVYILFQHTSWHEGYLTFCKSRMVSNRNLVYCAMNYGLPGKIKVHGFDPKNDWVPPLSSVPGPIRQAMVEANESPALLYNLKLSEDEIQRGEVTQTTLEGFLPRIEKAEQASRSTLHSVLQQVQIPDKVVADATEALMGVCVKTVGYERSCRILSHLGIVPKDVDVAQVLRMGRYEVADYFPIRHKVDQLLCNPDRIESILGYRFQNRTYLLQAFTHSSYTSHRLTSSYQQLEFLGDAVLDFLISMHIFERNPNMSPGQLTDLRSSLVNNVNLACVLVRYDLHLFILSQSPMLTDTIGKFVDVQRHNNNRTGDWVRLLTEESDISMAEYVDVPKVLGDVFEALIGAIYLDCKNDLAVVWQVCYRLMRDEIASFGRDTPIQIVRQLYEHPEAKPHFSAPIVEDEVVYVKLTYTYRSQRQRVYGFGKNKEDARRAAAKIALSKMV